MSTALSSFEVSFADSNGSPGARLSRLRVRMPPEVLCVVRSICRADHSSIEVLLNVLCVCVCVCVCDSEVLIIEKSGPLGAVEV